MKEALQLVAAMKGKTLIHGDPRSPEGLAYSEGANAAFNQAAEIAESALAEPDWLDSPEVLEVLSILCLTCSPTAHIYQAAGEGPKKRAEEEQGFILLKCLKFVREAGPKWRDLMQADINRAKAIAQELAKKRAEEKGL